MKFFNTRGGKLFTLSAAHALNDWYMNYMQTLLPFLVAGGLAVGKGAFLVSAFMFTSSLIQPVFGYIVDKKGHKWLVYVGTLWTALLLIPAGLITDYTLQFAIAAIAGLGTGAFHPQASAMVADAAGENGKGLHQSIFIAAGNFGTALTPLMLIPLVEMAGLKITPVCVLPGVIAAFVLWFSNSGRAKTRMENTHIGLKSSDEHIRTGRKQWSELMKLVCVVCLRSQVFFGFTAFLPLYLNSKGMPLSKGGVLVFIMLAAGALGGMTGGFISDIIGRKPVILGSLILSTPFLLISMYAEGNLLWISLALGGAALFASFSVVVVLSHELIGRSSAMASGLMLGFGIGVGGLGVGILGVLAEYIGIAAVVTMLCWFPICAAIPAVLLKPPEKLPGKADKNIVMES